MKPSRAMIPAEISWAYIALSLAWSGANMWPFKITWLNEVLTKAGHDILWPVFIVIPAAGLMFFSGREYIASRWPSKDPRKRWSLDRIESSARARGWLSLLLAFSFGYMVYVLSIVGKHPNSIMLIAVGGVVFTLWSWLENRRVQREYREHTGIFPTSASG